MLCGSDGRLKAFVSKLIRGKKKFLPSLPLKEKECVKRDAELHGRLMSLVKLPALTGLSEEEDNSADLGHRGSREASMQLVMHSVSVHR